MNFAERVLARLNETVIQESLRIAARDVIIDMRKRIFDDGLNSEGQPIGKYSTRPLLILKKDMPKVVRGTSSSATAVFFQGGYDQFKRENGYTKVNWRLFGNLMRDFATPKETLTGKSLTYSVKNSENQEKLDYLESHFAKNGSTISLSKKERENITKTFNFELQKRLFPPND